MTVQGVVWCGGSVPGELPTEDIAVPAQGLLMDYDDVRALVHETFPDTPLVFAASENPYYPILGIFRVDVPACYDNSLSYDDFEDRHSLLGNYWSGQFSSFKYTPGEDYEIPTEVERGLHDLEAKIRDTTSLGWSASYCDYDYDKEVTPVFGYVLIKTAECIGEANARLFNARYNVGEGFSPTRWWPAPHIPFTPTMTFAEHGVEQAKHHPRIVLRTMGKAYSDGDGIAVVQMEDGSIEPVENLKPLSEFCFPCPKCLAGFGKDCQTSSGRRTKSHAGRTAELKKYVQPKEDGPPYYPVPGDYRQKLINRRWGPELEAIDKARQTEKEALIRESQKRRQQRG